jgi:hypothetical protein
MRQCWLAPNAVTYPDRVFVESSKAPSSSPAPAGNPIVPAGYIRQIGSDGYTDTRWTLIAGVPVTVTRQFVVPYFSGGWPPDPLTGTPGHTAQRPTGQG